MRRNILVFIFSAFLCFVMGGCDGVSQELPAQEEKKVEGKNVMVEDNQQNRLAKEKSPYLLQHADNPVDWYPWGEEAFAKAKREDKPIFLSIGYSTCHWCHVMEHESFENPQTAKIMNEYFVSIKVDREERPDIDNVYMTAVMTMTGSGGWPLSVFLTPDKEPFLGGTYYPAEPQWGMPGFTQVLLRVNEGWRNNRKEILESSSTIVKALQSGMEQVRVLQVLDKGTLESAYQRYVSSYDASLGGFGKAPKFPSSHNLSFLLRHWKRFNNPRALEMVEKTLKEMAKGGMYDHVGGGFHRYSTDRYWFVPHFEKMLYDQAILAKTYLEAYQATGKDEYKKVAREIFDYVLRDMRDEQGGFYSAEDADSLDPDEFKGMTPDKSQSHKKVEGAFYVWRYQEILEHLGEVDGKIFAFHYGVKSGGNVQRDPHQEFKGKNILTEANDLKTTAKEFNKSSSDIVKILEKGKQKLFEVRSSRPRPHLDDKILVDWNGLMISSLAYGASVLDEPQYRQAAQRCADFIISQMIRDDGRLMHRYREGEVKVIGSIEDYAFFIHGLIDLYQLTFKTKYLRQAKQLTKDMIELFEDDSRGAFYFTSDDAEKFFLRQKEVYDGAIPSGNSIAALNLIRLGRLTLETQYEKKAAKLFKYFADQVTRSPNAFSQLLIALDFAIGPSKEIVVVGDIHHDKTKGMFEKLNKEFIPNKVVVHRPISDEEARAIIALVPFIESQVAQNGETTAYVCVNHVCKQPTTNVKEFEELLKQ